MLAFAANSVLCRLALGHELIDAASFASARVVSGAVFLTLIALPRWRVSGRQRTNWWAVFALFAYMASFSFAYLSLAAGTGALILFGAVQLTMFIVALRDGEHFALLSWFGLALAVAGLIWLVSPGVTAPDPAGATLMAVAGIAWGAYSLLGRGIADPLQATANNFICCVPLVLIVSAIFINELHFTTTGLAVAVASGTVASGLGYVIWYAALAGLTSTRAATVQLSVPAIAALGGALWLSEEITLRLILASAATLGGVWIVLGQRSKNAAESA